MINQTKILLILIIILASVLRFYQLGVVPPSISWDEAAVGYNAWTISEWGRDEYGKFFPAFFKSFGDDKHPVHIYSTAMSVKLLGLSEFSTRLPAAIFGVFNVILLYFLIREMFGSSTVGLAASFFLAISPYNIHFSRFNHEANFALFFFMLGLFLFYKALKKSQYLPLSALSFGICFISYHPPKIIVPLIGGLLLFLYGKQLLKHKKSLLSACLVILIFVFLVVLNPELLGMARVSQTFSNQSEIEKTPVFKLTNNNLLGRLNLMLVKYSWHFTPQYLFTSGDKNPRLSDQKTGQFYLLDGLFLLIGLPMILKKHSKAGLVLLSWALFAPIPSAFTAEAPHGARALFMMGSFHTISALGFYQILTLFKKPVLKSAVLVLTVGVLGFFLYQYLMYYYKEYAVRNGIDWQYGMKQIVQFTKKHQEYSQVFVSPVRSQPYIFFLYYLKVPLPDYLTTVIYNNGEDKSYNSVASFDKYSFRGFNPFESEAQKGVLYALSPSEYDGLKFRLNYDVKEIIYYPNKTTAFYLVSLK